MKTITLSLAVTAMTFCAAPSFAKDMFTLTGQKTASGAPIQLRLIVVSDLNLGIIREAGDYDAGEWDLAGSVPCGLSTRYFEVWTKRNIGDLPDVHIPGIPAGGMRANFSLVGGVEGTQSIVVNRDTKGTLKRKSHWKGQDFGVNINLVCK